MKAWRPRPWLSVLTAVAVLSGCAVPGRQKGEQPVSLVDTASVGPRAGEADWEYVRSAEADLDADGAAERIVLTANVSLMNDRPLWEDGHTWNLYVEAPGGERTDLYARFIPFGHLEVLFSAAEPGGRPRLILIERAQMLLGIYRVAYRGPHDALAVRLAHEPLDPTVAFDPPQEATRGVP